MTTLLKPPIEPLTSRAACCAKAFSAGSDARLAGRPITTCPYRFSFEPNARAPWLAGYLDVQRNWGQDAKWAVQPLKEVSR